MCQVYSILRKSFDKYLSFGTISFQKHTFKTHFKGVSKLRNAIDITGNVLEKKCIAQRSVNTSFRKPLSKCKVTQASNFRFL